ncbi:uncharacterized protein LOC118762143 [Octopus sinensis]|uniref:Uncharacterized protein LOC118762143 n=1 Tax=Octopus sinensis TaxID=2607531 RepID=A0A7E6EM22_9MOLL|nr:uncharacterized protein LOC118762143 [Octopus sinensis]
MMSKQIKELFVLIQTMAILLLSEEIPNKYKNIPECYSNCSFEDRKMPSKTDFNKLTWSHPKQDIVKIKENQISSKDGIANGSMHNPKNKFMKVPRRLYQTPQIYLKRRRRDAEINIYKVAALLAKHKYRGTDPRRLSSVKKLYQQFPMPPVMHPMVRKACELGLRKCINEIANFQNFRRASKLSNFSKTEQFEYLTTASYYMCWFTMLRKELLRELDNYNHYSFKCLHFNILQESRNSLRSILKKSVKPPIFDIRLIKYRRPFLCAELSFCPDPCYGGNTQGNILDIDSDSSNPCSLFPDSRCLVDQSKNINFVHLMHNNLNYSCNCHQMSEGFTWDKELRYCVDLDECAEGIHNCPPHMKCQNTVGSFNCLCSWGYRWNGETCTDTPIPHLKPDDALPVKVSRKMQQNKRYQTSGEQSIKNQHYLKTTIPIFIYLTGIGIYSV